MEQEVVTAVDTYTNPKSTVKTKIKNSTLLDFYKLPT